MRKPPEDYTKISADLTSIYKQEIYYYRVMPWKNITDLPPEIRKDLPAEAQKLFLGSLNSAYDGTCKDRTDREASAIRIAWGTVKKQFKQENGKWVRKAGASSDLHLFRIALASESKLLISGPLIEIGKKKLNGWASRGAKSLRFYRTS